MKNINKLMILSLSLFLPSLVYAMDGELPRDDRGQTSVRAAVPSFAVEQQQQRPIVSFNPDENRNIPHQYIVYTSDLLDMRELISSNPKILVVPNNTPLEEALPFFPNISGHLREKPDRQINVEIFWNTLGQKGPFTLSTLHLIDDMYPNCSNNFEDLYKAINRCGLSNFHGDIVQLSIESLILGAVNRFVGDRDSDSFTRGTQGRVRQHTGQDIAALVTAFLPKLKGLGDRNQRGDDPRQ